MRRLLGRAHEREMPFLEHLEELRRALLGALAALVVCSGGAYLFSGQVVDYIVVHHVGEAQFLRPMEAFLVRVKVSLLLGLLVALPFVMFQIWNFIVPGLLDRERRLVIPMVVSSTLLFLGGTAFSYLVLTPTMVKLLVGFATPHIRANISVEYLLDFIIRLAVACGILFQLPLVVALLTLIRVVTPRFLWSKWRHAIVLILIISAVATPGDGPSQIVLAAPIIVLYFVSILVSLLIVRSGGREEAPDGNDGGDGDGDDGGGGGEVRPEGDGEHPRLLPAPGIEPRRAGTNPGSAPPAGSEGEEGGMP